MRGSSAVAFVAVAGLLVGAMVVAPVTAAPSVAPPVVASPSVISGTTSAASTPLADLLLPATASATNPLAPFFGVTPMSGPGKTLADPVSVPDGAGFLATAVRSRGWPVPTRCDGCG